MKYYIKMSLPVLVAVVVGIGCLSYWRISSWDSNNHVYYGESTITIDQYNELLAFRKDSTHFYVPKLEVKHATSQSVSVEYGITSSSPIIYLPETQPTTWYKINHFSRETPEASILSTLGVAVMMIFVISRFTKKREDKPTKTQERTQVAPPMTIKGKLLLLAMIVYAISGTAITVLAIVRILPVWLFPVPFSLLLLVALIANRKHLFRSIDTK